MFINQRADLSHIFGCDLEQNQTGVLRRQKRAELFSVFLRHYKNRFPDFIECNVVGDTKTPLLRCILFILVET